MIMICNAQVSRTRSMNKQKRIRSIVIMAFVTVFMDMMNYALIVPILPFLVKELNSTSMQEGILFSSYSIMQLISNGALMLLFRFTVDGTSQ